MEVIKLCNENQRVAESQNKQCCSSNSEVTPTITWMSIVQTFPSVIIYDVTMIIRTAYTLVRHHFVPYNEARINLIRVKLN
jgi:hypothetical protein